MNTTKNKILSEARNLLVKKNILELNIDEITNAAEISKGSFYNYFENKSELVVELVCQYLQRLINVFDKDNSRKQFEKFLEFNQHSLFIFNYLPLYQTNPKIKSKLELLYNVLTKTHHSIYSNTEINTSKTSKTGFLINLFAIFKDKSRKPKSKEELSMSEVLYRICFS
jgi:AcrR family transcriptional regulator